MTGIRLIVGLGNPGAEYEDTRHNAGAWFVENIANDSNVILRSDKKFHGKHAVAKIAGVECHLLIPTTFMNLSGRAVQAVMSYYKISSDALLVAHDEIDIPAGDIRLKLDGGHGGHNGLRDIIDCLHTKQFYRLRIGVGHPGNSKLVVDYVLHQPKKDERKKIDTAMQTAETVLPQLVAGEFQKAMQELHS